MNANLRKIHATGQRVSLDHITRERLTRGRLASYASITVDALAARLQREGVTAFVTLWSALSARIAGKDARRALTTGQLAL